MAATSKTNGKTNGKTNAKASKATSKAAGLSKAPLTLGFTFERETKNTFRFAETVEPTDRNAIVLYLPKSALGDKAPNNINVTVSAA